MESHNASDEHHHLQPVSDEEIYALSRPDKSLLTLYVLYALAGVVFFPIVMLPLYFRYKTLRYTFDTEGVAISYGLLWRRESYLTYSRIQDIHITRNIAERWLGLGTVAIQTAAGSADAEEHITGLREYAQVRNFLYARMRGIGTKKAVPAKDDNATERDIELLQAIRDELHQLNTALKEAKR